MNSLEVIRQCYYNNKEMFENLYAEEPEELEKFLDTYKDKITEDTYLRLVDKIMTRPYCKKLLLEIINYDIENQ